KPLPGTLPGGNREAAVSAAVAAVARRPVFVAALVGGLVLLVTVLGLPGHGDHTRTVQADFAATNELRSGDPVRVGGVKVGAVGAIELHPEDRMARVTLRIDN